MNDLNWMVVILAIAQGVCHVAIIWIHAHYGNGNGGHSRARRPKKPTK